MIKYFFIAIIFLCSSVGSLFAQSGWFPLRSFISHKMYAIHFINADTGFLADASLYKTTNGG